MSYKYFSKNGQILPSSQAMIPLSNIEYSYGFGVYETIRVSHGEVRFLPEHCKRLMESALIIDLEHTFSPESVADSVQELITKNQANTCNVKVLLLGASHPKEALLYIMCLNPRFPDRNLYKHGAHVVTKHLERPFPHAKTLNMLPSYLAYREAKAAGAYEALLVNRDDCITEGAGSNFFAMKGRTIFSPPESDILLGVTRDNVQKIARKNGYIVKEKSISLDSIKQYDSLFLTSTSAKIMPIGSVDILRWDEPAPALSELMEEFNRFLNA